MPDILIRGMEMPSKENQVLLLTPDGDVWLMADMPCETEHLTHIKAVELPPHGDLIDADSLANDLLYDVELAGRALDDTTLVGKEREYLQSEKDIKQNCAYYVKNSPVIVPASEEATNG